MAYMGEKRKKNHFFNKWYQQHWINTSRKLKLYTGIKIHSKFMKDCNIGLETLKQLDKNLRKTLKYVQWLPVQDSNSPENKSKN